MTQHPIIKNGFWSQGSSKEHKHRNIANKKESYIVKWLLQMKALKVNLNVSCFTYAMVKFLPNPFLDWCTISLWVSDQNVAFSQQSFSLHVQWLKSLKRSVEIPRGRPENEFIASNPKDRKQNDKTWKEINITLSWRSWQEWERIRRGGHSWTRRHGWAAWWSCRNIDAGIAEK